MNIFYLDSNVAKCAEYHNDKHVVKMILEYAQLLSTAHRVLDGTVWTEEKYVAGSLPPRYRKAKRWKLFDDSTDSVLYKATHINHPSAVWARQSNNNYNWLYCLFVSLMSEYTYRYGKTHACARLAPYLQRTPKNIPVGYLTQPTPAMPDNVKIAGDSIKSYRNYYINNKAHLASWKKRSTPGWYNANI
jgi:hypothetical protein